MYCDTIYRTEVGGGKPFCIVALSIGQKLEAANPSVLWHHLQDRNWRQQTLLYCCTIYRSEVGAANPTVLGHNLQDRRCRQQNLLYCDTIYRTDVGGSKTFCIVTQSTGQKLEAADPSVL